MTRDSSRTHADQSQNVTTDLVEYMIVSVPDVGALGMLAPALVELVHARAVRILDLVVLMKDGEGAVRALELDEVESLAILRNLTSEVGEMLSEHDIQLASLALRPGTAGLVLLTEDRWAEPLSEAAQRAGGQIIAGERIPSARVETALADRSDADQTDQADRADRADQGG